VRLGCRGRLNFCDYVLTTVLTTKCIDARFATLAGSSALERSERERAGWAYRAGAHSAGCLTS
jgi:hypothetical protein